jgi:hypothetical protein
MRIFYLEITFLVCKTSGFYSSIAENASLLGCDDVFMGK